MGLKKYFGFLVLKFGLIYEQYRNLPGKGQCWCVPELEGEDLELCETAQIRQ